MPRAPRRNRVTPTGDIVAITLRGAWLGNRGILHEDHDIVRFHASSLWITCALKFKDWRLPQWQPHHFTLLFFHDEAVALAAGHRPCALCRRDDYNAYRRAFAGASGVELPGAQQLDRRLHGERLVRGTHRRRLHRRSWSELPVGAFVLDGGAPLLVLEDAVVPWNERGYGVARSRPSRGDADVLTPPSSLAALRGGYRPHIDAGAYPATR
ncbi:MAG: hypothetical protein ACRDPG_07465 [Nocardioidaceae bacterium]